MLQVKSVRKILFAAGTLALLNHQAMAVPVQWTSGTGANNHYYERIEQTGLTYDQAVTAAAGLSFNGLPGHLAIFETANYANEFAFVDTNVYAPSVTNNRGYWAGASWNGQGSNRDTWIWLDGATAPTSITNGWNVDQAEGAGAEGILFFQLASHTLWDYIKTNSSNLVSGYVVEYEQVPEPATASLMLLGISGMALRRRR